MRLQSVSSVFKYNFSGVGRTGPNQTPRDFWSWVWSKITCKPTEDLLTRRRVRSFGVIWIRISDPRSLGSWCIKGTCESTLVTDSSVPLMYHDLSDLGLLILIQITPKERTLSSCNPHSEFWKLWNFRTKFSWFGQCQHLGENIPKGFKVYMLLSLTFCLTKTDF